MNELPGSPGPTMRTLSDPTLGFAFALILIGYSVWDLDQLSGSRYSVAVAGAGSAAVDEFLLSSAVTVGGRVAMGVAMAFLLLVAI